MKKRYAGILVALLLSFAGCKKEPDPKYTVVYYSWNYDADRDSSFIGANVTDNRTGMPVSAEIRFNNDLISATIFGNGYYNRAYQGYIDTGTFTYTDADGVVYTNQFAFIPKRSFPASLTSVNHNTGNVIPWLGEPSRPGEEFTICVRNIIGGNEYWHCSLGVGADSTSHYLVADTLSALVPGTNNAIIQMQWNRLDLISSASPAPRSLTQGIYGPSKVISVY